ncbi:hypothetical protein R1X32_26665 [Rhodococcus opacus]|uniref:Uncharacterized protein n=1 Tax=Rhodococcus opacus TaxID=37919 RepID=A0AAX3YFB0_RHOOP|nr:MULTISPECIES: hypothetical protein [Rhodococcus]ELB87581.1 hypothetical protein Rwratislav_39118 [Rhodococcus wratislaviensis IFP 2016]MBA8958300.1 hypothetical protein [Rhodococcus opacus]MBP2203865.1 hypothetical protein [Rhodococcus opacus]MCZ4588970.1 hypothetical protein [Rhodococcus opacus]MDI9940299.1 hypothetical protein [Rhodococcus sp. IEGM 1351]
MTKRARSVCPQKLTGLRQRKSPSTDFRKQAFRDEDPQESTECVGVGAHARREIAEQARTVRQSVGHTQFADS